MARLGGDELKRLEELEARAEITDLINRYGDGVRRDDIDLIMSCFSDTATIDHGNGRIVEGKAHIRAFYEASRAPGSNSPVLTFDEKVASTPVMSNIVIELEGDNAHCESMCLAIHVGVIGASGSVMVRGTRNIDDLVRTPDGWKIERRSHPALWMFEVPGTILVERP